MVTQQDQCPWVSCGHSRGSPGEHEARAMPSGAGRARLAGSTEGSPNPRTNQTQEGKNKKQQQQKREQRENMSIRNLESIRAD